MKGMLREYGQKAEAGVYYGILDHVVPVEKVEMSIVHVGTEIRNLSDGMCFQYNGGLKRLCKKEEGRFYPVAFRPAYTNFKVFGGTMLREARECIDDGPSLVQVRGYVPVLMHGRVFEVSDMIIRIRPNSCYLFDDGFVYVKQQQQEQQRNNQ